MLFTLALMVWITGTLVAQQPQDTVASTEAVVYVSFVVTPDGAVRQVAVDSMYCPSCSAKRLQNFRQSAIKSVKSMPPLSDSLRPRKKTRFILPIRYVLK